MLPFFAFKFNLLISNLPKYIEYSSLFLVSSSSTNNSVNILMKSKLSNTYVQYKITTAIEMKKNNKYTYNETNNKRKMK